MMFSRKSSANPERSKLGSFSKRFASGLKRAGSFLTRSISIQDAMSRAPSNCRDATQPTLCITCGRLGKINRFAAGLQVSASKRPKQQRKLRAAISRSEFYNRVFHSTEDPHEEAPAVGAVPVLQRIMSSASGVSAN